MQISRRSFLLSGAGLAACALINIRPAQAAIQEISGIITAVSMLTSQEPQKAKGLLYTQQKPAASGASLNAQQNTPLKWTLSNASGDTVNVRLRGIRAAVTVDGKRITGSSVSIAAQKSALIEFTPRDQGSFFASLQGSDAEKSLLGAVPIIVEGGGPKFEQDVTIIVHDQPKTAATPPALDYFINSGMQSTTVFSQGALVRLRLMNATRTTVLPFAFAGGLIRTIALDGHAIEPYEPYQGRLALSPGQRADVAVFIPQNQIQSFQIDTLLDKASYPLFTAKIMQSLRAPTVFDPKSIALPQSSAPVLYELADSIKVDWNTTQKIDKIPFFEAKIGKTIVLTVDNPLETPTYMSIEGHCFRPMDLLDDGMKPYVRDAFMLPPKSKTKLALIPNIAGTWRIFTYSAADNNIIQTIEFSISA